MAFGLFAPARAHALQPLDTFVQGARHYSPDNREAEANLAQQDAQAGAALGRVLPGIALRGAYTRNQYETAFPTSQFVQGAPPDARTVLTPYNQFDATGTLNVPLIDLSSFVRLSAARTGREAADQQRAGTALQVESAVVQDYYQLVAQMALVDAAQKALEVAQTNLKLTQAQFQAGKAAVLDVDRASAEVERQAQQVTAAELSVELAARALQSASGITPDTATALQVQPDDLHEEPALQTFNPADEQLPSIEAAVKSREAAEKQALAQRLTLVPSLSGSVTERITNAAGFVGHESSWQAVVALNWQLDYSTLANIRAQEAAADASRAREDRAKLAVRDAIHRTWATVHSGIARSRSARAQAKASTHAAELAQDRYQAGAATQLDLLQAQRDAFSAVAGQIQAEADLANARAQLRLAAGQDPFASSSKGTP